MSRSILKNSSKIGFLALISRCIAFLREVLIIRFLSVGTASDIFFTAFRIPNTLRKIFAEGLLSSILVPAIVHADHKGGKKSANKLTTLSFLVIESAMFLFCMLIYACANWVIYIIAPGFEAEKVQQAEKLLQILISFILFISSGAIFAAALQAQQKFFIPAIAPFLLNILYVASLIICLWYKLPIETFCWFMIATSIAYFLIHLAAYFYMHNTFEKPDQSSYQEFKTILIQFLPGFLSAGILEINHVINTRFGSYLPTGSLTLMRYAFQFVNIPIGIIAASLSTVLLPHFSKIKLKAPEELSEQVTESVKFTIWSTMPICFLLAFFSKDIFHTLFLGDQQALDKINLAQSIFIAYLLGLISFSLNKIFLSLFYALRLSFIPMCTTLVAIIINFSLNKLLLHTYQATGIAFAASIASIVQSILFFLFLYLYIKLPFEKKNYIQFLTKFCLQFITCTSLFLIAYYAIYKLIDNLVFNFELSGFGYSLLISKEFFLSNIGIWCWAGPLSLLFLCAIYYTKDFFQIKLAYFDKNKA